VCMLGSHCRPRLQKAADQCAPGASRFVPAAPCCSRARCLLGLIAIAMEALVAAWARPVEAAPCASTFWSDGRCADRLAAWAATRSHADNVFAMAAVEKLSASGSGRPCLTSICQLGGRAQLDICRACHRHLNCRPLKGVGLTKACRAAPLIAIPRPAHGRLGAVPAPAFGWRPCSS